MNSRLLAQVKLPDPSLGTGGVLDPFAKDTTIGSILTGLTPYIMALAGMYMLVQIITGGITLMTSAGEPGAMKKGYGSVQFGIIGFIIIFCAYFAVQIIEVALGVEIF